jgi:multidrug efflux system outer membrane protein
MIWWGQQRERRPGMRCQSLAVAVVVLVGGCTVGPDYEAPRTEMPDLWQQKLTEGLAEGKADLRTWWTVLSDPVLDGLIDRATVGNLDLKQAVARILQARAQLGIAGGEQFPSVDATGTVERSRISNEVAGSTAPPQKRTDTFYSGGLDASWELDFWGRIRRNVESADASLGGSIWDYRDTLVVLYADVATNYVEIRTLQARIQSALNNVKTQQGALRLTIDRNRAGLAPDLDVRQAELNLATTEAFVPQLRSDLAQALHRLAVLLGEFPSAIDTELAEPAPIPGPPKQVSVGLPAELLRQRPDIRAAERQLAAQTAQIGVATSDLYPRFTLSGAFAFEAFSLSNLFKWDARSWSFGPAFRWNIFDAGRIRSNINLQDALTQQLLASYEQTVLTGVEDVEDAIAAYTEEKVRQEALRRSVVAAQASTRLVETLYRTGLTDFQNVLDTQRSLFTQEDQLAQSTGLVTENLIRLYKALGGGWAPEAEQAPAAAGTAAAPKAPSDGTQAS